MRQTFDKKLFFALFLIILGAISFMIYITLHTWTLMRDTGNWVEKKHEILLETEKIISSIKDVETGSRGFIITGDEAFLAPYNRAHPKVIQHIHRLQQLIAGNREQEALVDSLIYYTEKRLDNALEAIVIRRTKSFDEADIALVRQGKFYMDHIRSMISQIRTAEEKMLHERNQEKK